MQESEAVKRCRYFHARCVICNCEESILKRGQANSSSLTGGEPGEKYGKTGKTTGELEGLRRYRLSWVNHAILFMVRERYAFGDVNYPAGIQMDEQQPAATGTSIGAAGDTDFAQDNTHDYPSTREIVLSILCGRFAR